MKYASIIPLIGGQTIGMRNAFGGKPEWLASFDGFQKNDCHAKTYFNNTPYIIVDTNRGGEEQGLSKVDVISTTCPCAGLSGLSTTAGADNPKNEYMYQTAEYVLSELEPKVFWGENAPRLATRAGKKVLNRLKEIAEKNGYALSIYYTSCIYHGLPQYRPRTFYFFWRNDVFDGNAPALPFIRRENIDFKDLINNIPKDATQQIPLTKNKPLDNAYYQYFLREIAHCSEEVFKETYGILSKQTSIMTEIYNANKFEGVSEWMTENGYERQAKTAKYKADKIKSGKNVMMRDSVILPGSTTNAWIGWMPYSLMHPTESRFLTYREALTIMGMPLDFDFNFEEAGASYNHICQNVPVNVATDMAKAIGDALDNTHRIIETNKIVCIDNHKQKIQYIE